MKKNIPIYCFTILICSFILFFFLFNVPLFVDSIENSTENDYDFDSFTNEIQTQYTSSFFEREGFININGLFTRLIGKKSNNNKVDMLKNGMLINSNIVYTDTSNLSKSINKFGEHLSNNGVEFLYVQLPMKVDKDNSLILTGNVNFANQNSDELLAGLNDNIKYIDARDYITSTPEDVKQYFYRTDHHWNTYGAFKMYGVILDYLASEFPDKSFDLSYADISNWNSTVYNDWFLGSLGKRVGALYAGVDDLTVLTPKFETNMSMYVTNHKKFTLGSFEDTVINNGFLDKKDYFGENPYCVYVGGDYPLVNHINNNATNDLKVLIIKDSFSLPLQSFLSTSVKELDVIDARYFNECSIAEYVDVSKPDIVIMAINPSVFRETKYQNFGIDKAEYHINQVKKTEVEIKKSSFELTATTGNNYAYTEILGNLEYNTKYTVNIENITSLVGDSEGVTIALYNKDTQKFVSSYVFNLEFCKENGFEWSFVTPNIKSGNLQILIYAGLHSKTANNSLKYEDITVYKYE